MKKTVVSIVMSVLVLSFLAVGRPTQKAEAAVKDFSYTMLADGTYKITGYHGRGKKVTVPKKIKGNKVTKIGDGWVFQGSRIKTLIIPEGVEEISEMALFDMQNLKKLQLPLSLKKLPKKCGIGYHTEAGGFSKITISCVKGSPALRDAAKYFSSQKIKARKSNKVMILFKANGGSVLTNSRIAKKTAKYGKLPIARRGGYKFKGWYTAKKGGKKVTKNKRIKKTVLYAHWKLVNKKAAKLHNPVCNDEGAGSWDCVYFGNYFGSDASGRTKEKIRWRVLSVSGTKAFLLADRILDVKPFCEESQYSSMGNKISWKTSTLRSWLNGYGGNFSESFMSKAFTSAERAAMQGGDKVTLLGRKDIVNPLYGFSKDAYSDTNWSRSGGYTGYAEKISDDMDRDDEDGDSGSSSSHRLLSSSCYWLGTNADSRTLYYVEDGCDVGRGIPTLYGGIRPVIRLDLSKTNLWSKAKRIKEGK